ncbi:MAG: hypothetical protein U0Y68_16115 [Blastocatellia bacterium]
MSLMLAEIAEQPPLSNEPSSAKPRAFIVCCLAQTTWHSFYYRDCRARGSSDNASSFGQYLLEITTGIPVSRWRLGQCIRFTA